LKLVVYALICLGIQRISLCQNCIISNKRKST